MFYLHTVQYVGEAGAAGEAGVAVQAVQTAEAVQAVEAVQAAEAVQAVKPRWNSIDLLLSLITIKSKLHSLRYRMDNLGRGGGHAMASSS